MSSVELERACLHALPELLSEAAAVAVPEAGEGPDSLVIFVVLKGSKGSANTAEILSKCQKYIRAEVNPLFKVSKVRLVKISFDKL